MTKRNLKNNVFNCDSLYFFISIQSNIYEFAFPLELKKNMVFNNKKEAKFEF